MENIEVENLILKELYEWWERLRGNSIEYFHLKITDISEKTLDRIADSLEERGLIKGIGYSEFCEITGKGVLEAEKRELIDSEKVIRYETIRHEILKSADEAYELEGRSGEAEAKEIIDKHGYDETEFFNNLRVLEDLGLINGGNGWYFGSTEAGRARLKELNNQASIESGKGDVIKLTDGTTINIFTEQPRINSRKVFIVHGHDRVAKEAVENFLYKLKLEPIVLYEQPNQGKTIIEKFEHHSSDVGFAVVILTPDDLGTNKFGESELGPRARIEYNDDYIKDNLNPRARQNVIFELGYFFAKLGRAKICALHKENVELPSDIHGVIFTRMDANGLWKNKLAKEIRAAGLDVDLSTI